MKTFTIRNLSNNEILPITCGTRELAQKVANLLAAEEKTLFLVE